MSFTIQGRGISKGKGKGALLKSSAPISFLSGVDPDTGIVVEEGHPLRGESIAGKVLAFPFGKGSTVGSYVIYALKRNDKAPCAIINEEAETIIAVGAIISDIPMVDKLSEKISDINNGTTVCVDGDSGIILIEE